VFDLDRWEEIWISLSQHRLRTALTCFGVFWGIFMLVVLMGAGKGLENGAQQGFNIVKNAVFVWTDRTSVAYSGLEAGRPIQLTNGDLDALRRLEKLQVVAPRLRVNNRADDGGLIIERGDNAVSYFVLGDSNDLVDIVHYDMEQGRFINPFDVEQQRKVAVIGQRVREELFDEGEAATGEYVQIGGVPFLVIGVFTTRATGQDAIQQLQTVHIPYSTAQQTFNFPNRIHYLGLVPAPGVSGLEAEEAARSALRTRHRIAPEDRQALGSFNVEERYLEMQGMFIGIATFSWLVALGTIAAGMVGVANIMMIIVKERTREIGIRKSVGATPTSIVGMIVMEASVIAAVAGYLGLLCGVLLIEGIATLMTRFDIRNEFFANPEVDFEVAVTAMAVLLVAGILAGLAPGLRAAAVDPIVALRDN
jgi:putative ABC transport system permease protein